LRPSAKESGIKRKFPFLLISTFIPSCVMVDFKRSEYNSAVENKIKTTRLFGKSSINVKVPAKLPEALQRAFTKAFTIFGKIYLKIQFITTSKTFGKSIKYLQ